MNMEVDQSIVTMLCIDGGGIRGLIPATILIELEKQLQVASGRPNAHISEYFDVVSGTSTGGLIATMLTAPNPDNINEPFFRPREIQQYYVENGPIIFSNSNSWPPPLISGPKYDGKELRRQTESMLRYKNGTPMKLGETKTDLVIPTYDIYDFKPAIFSSLKVKGRIPDPNMNANLSDICLGTSAAPLLFPAIGFSTTSSDQEERKFNLIDGAVVANNPILMAVNEVAVDRMKMGRAIPSIDKFIVVSLGTGSSKAFKQFTAEQAAGWGVLEWVGIGNGVSGTPILDILFQGSADVVDITSQNLFQSMSSLDNYLRVQIDTLEGPAASVDDTTPENLEHLIKIGNDLLDSPATVMDEDTGRRISEPGRAGTTYRQRIMELAKKLVAQKGR